METNENQPPMPPMPNIDLDALLKKVFEREGMGEIADEVISEIRPVYRGPRLEHPREPLTFDVPDGHMTIGDPAYLKEGAWCMIDDLQVRPGRWVATVDDIQGIDHQRPGALYVWHASVLEEGQTTPACPDFKHETHEAALGVDSGAMCVIARSARTSEEADFEADASMVEIDDQEVWFDFVKFLAGQGVECRSGWGDGTYVLDYFTDETTGDIVGLMIVFAENEDEEGDEGDGID